MTVSTLTVVPEAQASGTAPCAEPPTFFLGTHQPHWLGLGVPLFVSDRRLRRYRTLPRAGTGWALDSGGFTELSTYGHWDAGPTPAEYVARIRRYAVDIGQLAWAAPQDWMFVCAFAVSRLSSVPFLSVANEVCPYATELRLPVHRTSDGSADGCW
jgi:hypothetical protein